jgi:hydrogenase-4 component B
VNQPIVGTLLLLTFATCMVGLLMSATTRSRAPLMIAVFGVLASLCMIGAGSAVLISGQSFEAQLWTIDGFGRLSLQLDALSSIFLVVAGIVYLAVSLFTRSFIAEQQGAAYPAHRYGVLYFALMASVVAIFAAGDVLLFLISWECMSILCFLSINHDTRHLADRAAGYVMLAMSEAGFLAVVIAFLIVQRNADGISFAALAAAASSLSPAARWSVFLLGFFGFGVKAGLVPVNFWLPRSYTAAPAVFVPVFAGVTLNLGFYGILRLNADVAHASYGAGIVALVIGSVTALVGILYATTESDLKTMLAHSSIENAGIVVAAIGAALLYRGAGQPVAAAIALAAGLYHMLNHSMYKTLLFQGAAHIESAAGTRDMDQLGGLARLMPALSALFLAGCLAISAVPPFNGFVSEWLALQALLRSAVLSTTPVKIVFALCGAALALTAALAVTCFVKAYAMTFLGHCRGTSQPRSGFSYIAHFPLGLLAGACLLLGILPTYVLPVLNRAIEPIAGTSVTTALVQPFFTATASNGQLPAPFLQDFHNIGAQTGKGLLPGRGLVVLLRGTEQNPVVFAMSTSYSLIALALLVFIVWFVVRFSTRKRSVARRPVWAGGIPRLLPQMTYTATGFSNPVRVVFQAVFQPNITEDTPQTVAVHFRTAIRRQREESHVVDRIFFHPVGAATQWVARSLARMHHGRLNAYVTYILAFLLLVLLLYRVT